MHHWHRFLTGVLFFTVSAVALAPNGLAAETRGAGSFEKARKLYLMKCAKCHRLYDPKSYDDAAWGEWMEKMKKKSRLNDEQYEQISRYTESLRKGN